MIVRSEETGEEREERREKRRCNTGESR